MQKHYTRIAALAAGIVVSAVGCSGGSSGGSDTGATAGTSGSSTTTSTTGGATTDLTGAGSTFVFPAMSKWTYAYHEQHPEVTVNYQSVGSGAGIAQFKAGTVDFGATDVAMPDKDVASAPPLVQIPMIAGCTVMAYNLPGIKSGLKLSGDVI